MNLTTDKAKLLWKEAQAIAKGIGDKEAEATLASIIFDGLLNDYLAQNKAQIKQDIGIEKD